MVVYDLICSSGHHFEGWFKNLKDLSGQLQRGLLACPVCGDERVSRRPSTFGLVRTGRAEAAEAEEHLPPPTPPGKPDMFRQWRDFSQRLERDFDDVGQGFADEALKMHYGVTERRSIRGLSTEAQEDMLRKEGIEFFKVPMLTRKSHPSSN